MRGAPGARARAFTPPLPRVVPLYDPRSAAGLLQELGIKTNKRRKGFWSVCNDVDYGLRKSMKQIRHQYPTYVGIGLLISDIDK